MHEDAEGDPVERLLSFKDKHPEVTIKSPSKETGGFWLAYEGETEIAMGYWLYRLMDKLAQKYS